MSLVDKIRKAREQSVEAGGYTFTVRRPTDVEMLELRGTGSIARLFRFVVGWEGVKEIDLVPGGDPHPVPFDADICTEWLSDHPEIFGPLVDAILGGYRQHAEALETGTKN